MGALRIGALIFALALVCVPAHAQPARPHITIAQGRLAGAWDGDIRVFRGIPYAAPPIGDRRWRPPAPPARWRGARDASRFGASCAQPPYPRQSVYFEELEATSEDCLTLNIWAPRNARRAPVIVWIHGGALLRGSSTTPMYDGAAFARRGVVFVSINYRLGVFGWLAHPDLSAESPEHISGNYGLLDQVAALHWVRDNIHAAGGDPDNITVMGESAGALSITYLLTSPRARGLVAKAILQSANTRAVPLLREGAFGLPPAETIGATLAESAGAPTLAELRALDTETLIAAALRARFVSQGTIDGAVLPLQVVDAFDRGQQAAIPILAGFNSGEARSQRELVPAIPESAAIYEHEITRRYLDLAPDFLRIYPSSNMQESLLAATRDAVYGWAIERMARAQTAAGQPAYMYVFDHCTAAARARDLCAFHASELPFVFNQAATSSPASPNWPVGDVQDQRLAEQMIDYWASFARTGAPAAANAPAWAPYGAGEAFMRFNATPMLERDPFPGMFELQEEVVARRRARGQQWLANIGPDAPLP